MSVRYRNIFPQSQQPIYAANENVDFILNLEGEKLVPGSVSIEGRVVTFLDRTAPSYPLPYSRVYIDGYAGAHALFRDFTTEFQQLGIVENFQNYPRYVKMQTMATSFDESVGTETNNSIELKCSSARIAKGYLEGVNSGGNPYPGTGNAAEGRYLPFSIKPVIALNKTSGPLSSSSTGQIRVRVRLAPDNEVYYGEDITVNTSYDITELRMRFQTIPDDGKKQPVQMEMYHCYRTSIDSNNVNVSTFVPGLADAVHMSFINQTDENTLNRPFLVCQPLIGQPPVGYSAIGTNLYDYGIERLYYAINDTDTALVGFTLQSREEILHNGLRSFNAPLSKYEGVLRKLRNTVLARRDGYIAGIPFGGLLNFQQNKFACEIQSQCDSSNNLYAAYLYFRMSTVVQA
jgi:hypothetical protein